MAELRVHPVADLFPMMSDEELQDLAADIKQNGLRYPIITDSTGEELVDGRNRLRACEIAGVEPRFERLNGQDAVAFILSANIARRHMSKGALAMVTAKALKLSGSGDSYGAKRQAAKQGAIAESRLHAAFTVLDYAPDLADGVVDGTVTLDYAYKQASERKRAKEYREIELRGLRRRVLTRPRPH